MVGLSTIRNNENSIMNYQSTLFEDVYESLTKKNKIIYFKLSYIKLIGICLSSIVLTL